MFFRRPDSSSISSLPAVSRLRPLCYADVTLAPACPTSLPACQARSAAGNMQEARVEHGTELTARRGFDPSPAAPHSARSSVANVLGEADDGASTVTDPPATSLVAAIARPLGRRGTRTSDAPPEDASRTFAPQECERHARTKW